MTVEVTKRVGVVFVGSPVFVAAGHQSEFHGNECLERQKAMIEYQRQAISRMTDWASASGADDFPYYRADW